MVEIDALSSGRTAETPTLIWRLCGSCAEAASAPRIESPIAARMDMMADFICEFPVAMRRPLRSTPEPFLDLPQEIRARTSHMKSVQRVQHQLARSGFGSDNSSSILA